MDLCSKTEPDDAVHACIQPCGGAPSGKYIPVPNATNVTFREAMLPSDSGLEPRLRPRIASGECKSHQHCMEFDRTRSAIDRPCTTLDLSKTGRNTIVDFEFWEIFFTLVLATLRSDSEIFRERSSISQRRRFEPWTPTADQQTQTPMSLAASAVEEDIVVGETKDDVPG